MSSGSSNDGWEPVRGDSRYEEKIVDRGGGHYTRMTRRAGQTSEYPHTTEFYTPDGKRHFDDNPMYDSHYSTGPGKQGEHYGTHKTAGAILDDLDHTSGSGGK